MDFVGRKSAFGSWRTPTPSLIGAEVHSVGDKDGRLKSTARQVSTWKETARLSFSLALRLTICAQSRPKMQHWDPRIFLPEQASYPADSVF